MLSSEEVRWCDCVMVMKLEGPQDPVSVTEWQPEGGLLPLLSFITAMIVFCSPPSSIRLTHPPPAAPESLSPHLHPLPSQLFINRLMNAAAAAAAAAHFPLKSFGS